MVPGSRMEQLSDVELMRIAMEVVSKPRLLSICNFHPPRDVPTLQLGLEVTTSEADEAPRFDDTTKLWRDIGAHFP